MQQLFGEAGADRSAPFTEPQQTERLARYFSQLGVAQALLELARPAEALEALAEAACDNCQQAQPHTHLTRLSVCAERCAHFDQYNPGYAGFEKKGARLRAAALELARAAHLAIAQAEITAASPNLATARTHWQAALALAQELAEAARTQHEIGAMVLGRSQALQRRDKLDAAIELLEQAQDLCREPELKGRLAECLVERGVAAANDEPPRWEAAVRDLRRAVRLNPHAPRARINLCAALLLWAGEYYERDDAVPAIALLEEASRCAREGLAFNQHNAQLREKLEEAVAGLSIVHNQRGVWLAEQEDWEAALNELEKALKLTPAEETVQQNLQSLLGSYAMALVGQGALEEALGMLGRALRRFYEYPAVRAEIAKLQLMLSLLGGRR